MLECNDFLCWNDVPSYVKALNVAFFESVRKLFDVVHNDQVVRNVQVFQGVVLLSDYFAQFLSRLSWKLSVRQVTHLDALGNLETLHDFLPTFVTNLLIIIDP